MEALLKKKYGSVQTLFIARAETDFSINKSAHCRDFTEGLEI